ncbi:AAA family ATPase [Halorussus ruber]|uniref:AAA family ATPase n=1 Tax=Halorussus ruber TaxID=1126238 RepID=UPI0010919F06|nr:AAA family ATPase [Halorussus ruber]
MRVKRIEVENLQSYDTETVSLPEGVISVHGENGAGKTTLLRAIFGGLFMTNMKKLAEINILDDLIRSGHDSAEIRLTFVADGKQYETTWQIEPGKTAGATLTSPSLDSPVEGFEDVQKHVEEIVGMDAETFVRSVYVQQGEIDRLLRDDDREELIDDLLELGQFDEYRAQAKGARRAARNLRDEAESRANTLDEQVEDGFEYDTDGYRDEIGVVGRKIDDTEGEKEEQEEKLDKLHNLREKANEQIERHGELKSEIESKKDERKDLVEKRDEQEKEKLSAKEQITENEGRIEELQSEVTDLSETVAETETPVTTDEFKIDLSTREDAEASLERAQDGVESAKVTMNDRENKLKTAKSDRERLESNQSELKGRRDEKKTEISQLEREIEAAKRNAGRAKIRLEDAVESRRETVIEFLPEEQRPDEVSDDTEKVVADALEEYNNQVQECHKRRASVETELDNVKEDLEDAQKSVKDTEESIEEIERDVETLEEKMSDAEDEHDRLRKEFTEQVAELDDRLAVFDLGVNTETVDEVIDDDLPAKREELQSQLSDAKEQVTELKTKLENLRETRSELDGLDGGAVCPTCQQEVKAKHLETKREDVEKKIQKRNEELEDAKQREAELSEELTTLEEIREDLLNFRTFRDDDLAEAKAQVEEIQSDLTDRREDRSNAEDELSAAESEESDAQELVEKLRAERAGIQSEIDDIESRVSAGKEALETFETVEERREAVDDAKDRVDDLQSKRSDLIDEREELTGEIEELDEKIESQMEAVTEAEDKFEEAKAAVDTAETIRDYIDDAVDAYDKIDDLQQEINNLENDIDNAQERIDELEERIDKLDGEVEERQEERDKINVDELEENLKRLDDEIDTVEGEIGDLEDEIQSLHERKTTLENELERLEDLHDKRDTAQEKREWAQSRADEFERLAGIYREVKTELRDQYLDFVEQFTNDIFREVYKNESYQQVEIVAEDESETAYAITLHRSDGETVAPHNASGGERAVVNLALRAGVYKLIAQRRGGDAERLPPLILDEPTTYLDDGHVGRLDQMLDTIADWGVPQILVVSHDDTLVDGAEHECRVTVDDGANASRVDLQRGAALGDD